MFVMFHSSYEWNITGGRGIVRCSVLAVGVNFVFATEWNTEFSCMDRRPCYASHASHVQSPQLVYWSYTYGKWLPSGSKSSQICAFV